MKIVRYAAWGLCAVFAIGLAFIMFEWYKDELNVQKTQAGQTKATVGGDFTLTDHTGKQVTANDFSDKPMVIYFGYTFCPGRLPDHLGRNDPLGR